MVMCQATFLAPLIRTVHVLRHAEGLNVRRAEWLKILEAPAWRVREPGPGSGFGSSRSTGNCRLSWFLLS